MSQHTQRHDHGTRQARPDPLSRIESLARNLWWTWDPDALRLLADLDPSLWDATHHGPLAMLRRLSPQRRAELDADPALERLVAECERRLNAYLRAGTWFPRTHRGRSRRLLVAYFCAEFGLHECLPIYSGGLGVLAGDHLKSASDLGVPLVGIGLLYRSGYYTQTLGADGTTRAVYPRYDFTEWPIADTGKVCRFPLGRRTMAARIWRATVGRVSLFLLDTDIRDNKPADRGITDVLYGGDREHRLRQEIVLGVGGVCALREMGIKPTVYHLNEGHAALCILERLRALVTAGTTLDQAAERVRRSTVFTTHTPVEAGHERFAPSLAMKYLAPTASALGLARKAFLGLARTDAADNTEPFCMTTLALRHAAHCNGVAELHGRTSRRMWMRVYQADTPDEVPIGHVTNGVHPQSWLRPEARAFYARYVKPRWVGVKPGDDWWRRAERIPPDELWALRCLMRRRLIRFVRSALAAQVRKRHGSAREVAAARDALSDDALTIGFARRFATYKRAPLIFTDPARLAAILGQADRPVQIIFAGKAHPDDAAGQAFLQRIFRYARRPAFTGRVVLLENYDIDVGRRLAAGCDVWLNTPVRPMEASGTSGMKGPLHGGLNCSILDGWWPEGYDGRNGWAIADASPASAGRARDRHDAEAIYELLEGEIVPTFYQRDRAGVPRKWARMMARSMKSICARFSAHRMVGEYVTDYYVPAHG